MVAWAPFNGEGRLAARQRALIVEDEVLVAWHLESLLDELGIEVCGMAANALEGVAKATAGDVDIVFMDINFGGGMDGVEAASQIRKAKVDIPIVFVTAYANDQAMISRINSKFGKSAVVGKPATPDTITAALLSLKSA